MPERARRPDEQPDAVTRGVLLAPPACRVRILPIAGDLARALFDPPVRDPTEKLRSALALRRALGAPPADDPLGLGDAARLDDDMVEFGSAASTRPIAEVRRPSYRVQVKSHRERRARSRHPP
jgi:hypothetical protein